MSEEVSLTYAYDDELPSTLTNEMMTNVDILKDMDDCLEISIRQSQPDNTAQSTSSSPDCFIQRNENGILFEDVITSRKITICKKRNNTLVDNQERLRVEMERNLKMEVDDELPRFYKVANLRPTNARRLDNNQQNIMLGTPVNRKKPRRLNRNIGVLNELTMNPDNENFVPIPETVPQRKYRKVWRSGRTIFVRRKPRNVAQSSCNRRRMHLYESEITSSVSESGPQNAAQNGDSDDIVVELRNLCVWDDILLNKLSVVSDSTVGRLTASDRNLCGDNSCINGRILGRFVLSKCVTSSMNVMMNCNTEEDIRLLESNCLIGVPDLSRACERFSWPITINNQCPFSHIISVMAVRGGSCVRVFDSAWGADRSTQRTIEEKVARMLKELWSLDGELGVVLEHSCPQQGVGTNDCGIFTGSFNIQFLGTGTFHFDPPDVGVTRREIRLLDSGDAV